MKSIHTIGVFLRPFTHSLKEYFFEFQELATSLGFEIILESLSAKMIGMQGLEFEDVCRRSDALLSIGGDGTLISVARRSFIYQKPILGINMGNLGFLTDLQKEEVETFFPLLKSGNYSIANHTMLEGSIDGECFFALNDIILRHLNNGSMIHLKASIDQEYFNSYCGDGLIIATPTGSTAYNISAGGAVVYPFSYNLLLTPICAHSLTQRPLVLPGEFEVDIEVGSNQECNVVIDGQENKLLKPHQCLHIRALKNGVKLIHNPHWNYFKILRQKFHWGE